MAMELDVGQPVLLPSGEGETVFSEPRRTLRILVDRDELTMTWFRYEPGEEGPEPHVHRKHTDAFYVLEGELELGLGPDVTMVAGTAGTFAAAPPGVVHTFKNSSDETAVFLNIHAPSMGFGEMLRARRDGRQEEAARFDQFEAPADGGRPLSEAIIRAPEDGERFKRENRELVIKAALAELSIFELTFHSGWKGVELHTHNDHVDSVFVLEGHMRVLVGDEEHVLAPGGVSSEPPGVPHGFPELNEGTLRLLNLHTPDAGFAAALREG